MVVFAHIQYSFKCICVLFQLNTDVHVDNVPKMSCDMPASTPDEVIISKMNVFVSFHLFSSCIHQLDNSLSTKTSCEATWLLRNSFSLKISCEATWLLRNSFFIGDILLGNMAIEKFLFIKDIV